MKSRFINSFRGILFSVPVFFAIQSFSNKEPGKAATQFLEHAVPLTDTNFIPNNEEGWSIASPYIQLVGDSVVFEVIFSRSRPANNDFSKRSLAGTIANAYAPKGVRSFLYKEPTRTWNIVIQPNGKCVFRFIGGALPVGDPIIIPIQTKFKK